MDTKVPANKIHRPTNFRDVMAFHDKFGLERPNSPTLIQDPALQAFRVKFLKEEIQEFEEACADGDLAKAADAMIDLVYVAMGTADLMGVPWQLLWDEVQRANMSKVRAKRATDSLRGSTYDVVKPDGWTAPDISGKLREYVNQQAERLLAIEPNRPRNLYLDQSEPKTQCGCDEESTASTDT